MPWFKQKQICIHCKVNKTKREFEGHPTCGNCEIKILIEREAIYRCPIDGTQMEKENHDDIIVDRCPQCEGVWLDPGELEAIKDAVNDSDASFATGLAVGISIGQKSRKQKKRTKQKPGS